MGKDSQPKHRQASQLARKKGQRASYDRVLIVTEGAKTEPNYFNEIRVANKLHTANVQVEPSVFGTEPIQIVEYAESLFLHGDESKGIQSRAFEEVYVVFDRDDHLTYHNALAKTDALNFKYLNDNKQKVAFKSIASVPCFELWLLLHFEEVYAPMHRNEVYERLKIYLPNYQKGNAGHYASTLMHIELANTRALALAGVNDKYDGIQSYTSVQELVEKLKGLNEPLKLT
ncbi:RloB family protein [Methylophilus aquaticus]|uniref:RloB family protein n=1 Tax=Methylophilus aquaticus TaxID=1971610 RepID=A0ABT9JTH5_9PROT|nr:RloB family protein [Methylophilus aquaticus]MDP8567831.1 RloB family protein [Methylophilus aquaticus]